MLLRLLDKVQALCPGIQLSVYVDDISAEATGPPDSVFSATVRAGEMLCDGLLALRLRLSDGKCLCTASSAALGHRIAGGLRRFGIRYAARVKSLGVGMGAGVRRNVQAQTGRFRQFASRLRRFAALLVSKVSVARVLRTGGTAALAYGDDVVGVSSSALLARRRAVAAAISPPTRGRALELTLILADLSDHQRLDPAFDAHAAPIARWAEAALDLWCPLPDLQRSVAAAKAAMAIARCPWSEVNGPAAAAVATAARIDWRFHDATTVITDQGLTLDLLGDPPAVVRKEVFAAVRRWRWRAVAACHPHLDEVGDSGSACLKPIQRILSPAARTELWTAAHQAALRSAIVNTQWTQARLFAAGLADVAECQLCAATATADPLSSPAAVNAAAARGTPTHRCFYCPVTEFTVMGTFRAISAGFYDIRRRARQLLGLPPVAATVLPHAVFHDLGLPRLAVPPDTFSCRDLDDDSAALADAGCDIARRLGDQWGPTVDWRTAFRREYSQDGCAQTLQRLERLMQQATEFAWGKCACLTAWTRALVPLPRAPARSSIPDGSFIWQLRPQELPIRGRFYTDGSVMDHHVVDGRAIGWAFVVVDDGGKRIAAAYGAAPDWITCISGAEAWALRTAASFASPGSHFFTDSLGCVDTIRRGSKSATAAHRPLARVWREAFQYFDSDDSASLVTWMPAHVAKCSIGAALRGDGMPLTRTDFASNRAADLLAKRGASTRRLPAAHRIRAAALDDVVTRVARFLGRVTWAANNCPEQPHRDACTLTRDERAARNRARAEGAVRRRRLPRPPRPVQLGGHDLALNNGKWTCRWCWRSSASRQSIAPLRCKGSAVAKWATRERELAGAGGVDGPSHARWLTDGIVWCSRCGAYAISWAVGLRKPCSGVPSCDGMRAVRNHIRSFRHPVTHAPLRGPHIPEPRIQLVVDCVPSERWGSGCAATPPPLSHVSRRARSAPTPAGDRIAAARARIRSRDADRRADSVSVTLGAALAVATTTDGTVAPPNDSPTRLLSNIPIVCLPKRKRERSLFASPGDQCPVVDNTTLPGACSSDAHDQPIFASRRALLATLSVAAAAETLGRIAVPARVDLNSVVVGAASPRSGAMPPRKHRRVQTAGQLPLELETLASCQLSFSTSPDTLRESNAVAVIAAQSRSATRCTGGLRPQPAACRRTDAVGVPASVARPSLTGNTRDDLLRSLRS